MNFFYGIDLLSTDKLNDDDDGNGNDYDDDDVDDDDDDSKPEDWLSRLRLSTISKREIPGVCQRRRALVLLSLVERRSSASIGQEREFMIFREFKVRCQALFPSDEAC